MAVHPTGVRYRHTGVLLLRATTHTADLPDADNVPSLDVQDSTDLHVWLTGAWAAAEVRRAVELASPVLARQIGQAVSTASTDMRQVRRLAQSLTSYLLRWQGRATPFGLFAGVTATHIGAPAAVRFGPMHRVVADADSGWLGAVIDRLEASPDLLDRVPVIANDAVMVRDGHIVVPGRPGSTLGDSLPVEVAVRLTRPVRAALAGAGKPVALGELGRQLQVRFPAAEPAQIADLLLGMVTQNLLLTRLRAPMTVPDALGHLRTQLDEVHADQIRDIADLVRQVRSVHDELVLHNQTACPAVASGTRLSASQVMRAVTDVTAQPLHVDLALDATVTIPEPVVVEATAAADALLRLSPHPFGYPQWKDYHLRFRRRYGVHAVVPLRDLIADTGLGLPAGYLGSPSMPVPQALSARDKTLLALVQQSTVGGAREVELTDALISALTVGDPQEVLSPPRVEVAFQIHAASVEGVQAGRFRLLVTGTPRAGSSMAGRFAELLPDADRDRLADAYAVVSVDDPDTVAVQLSFAARRRHSDNVVRTAQLLSHTIALAEHRDPADEAVGLDDLAVTADSRAFYLVQVSTGRRLEPRVLHALEAGTLTPPLARFLAEITTARCAVYKGFDWGAAARLPFLPRVRYRRTILVAARWLLSAADLPPRNAALPTWEMALTGWRHRWQVPAEVVMCESDLRLPIDLDQHAHRTLLRTRLDRGAQVELREAPHRSDLDWIGRAHELLLPLRLARPPHVERRPRPVRVATRDAGHLPGRSRWLYAQLYGHPGRHDDILTGHVPGLLAGFDDPPVWWFRRHRDMTHPADEQHLDLYLRLPTTDDYANAAGLVADWVASLRDHGLLAHLQLGTYQPQPGRYGHGRMMTAAEDVFAADSAAACAQIAITRTGTAVEAVTAAGLFDLARSFAAAPADGARWLLDALPHRQGAVHTGIRDEALHLADPVTGWAGLRACPGGDTVITAWHHRRAALGSYRRHLTSGGQDPLPVLRSLLHEHHVRTAGTSLDRERITERLARAAALRQITRHTGGAR